MSFEVAAHHVRPIPVAGVRDLYQQEHWWPERSADDLAAVIAAGPAVGAWDGDQLIGFARALTDGHFRAYVEDVVVDRARRGSGCGTALVSALQAELGGIDIVSLFCHPDQVAFYGKLGFRFTKQRIGHVVDPGVS